MEQQREVKFRLWNPERKVLTAGADLLTLMLTTDADFVSEANRCGYVWMQYTGLKDKNGKEIYEGDIVVAWSAGASGRFEIKWRQAGSPCFILYPAYQNNEFWHISATEYKKGKQFISVEGKISDADKEGFYDDGLEVIGNIYQNPSLLSPKTETEK